MRRPVALVLALLFALTCAVQAAPVSGKQADYSMTMTIDPATIAKAMQAIGLPAQPKGSKQGAIKLPPITIKGKSIWSGQRSRMELTSAKGEALGVSLTDLGKLESYYLDTKAKTAWKTALKNPALAAALSQGSSTGGASMVMDYDTMLSQIKQTKGVTFKELTPKKVNGYDCKGVSYTIDLSQVKDQVAAPIAGMDTQSQAMLSSLLGGMGTLTGETWVSTKHRAAVKILTNMGGSRMVMEFKNIADWSGDDSKFAVPPGYAVKQAAPPAKPHSAH
jgi:hypothetical protein